MKVITLYIILFAYCFSINFELQNYSASINIELDVLNQPFTGGTNYARISWYDWDQDNDMDLFLLDEDLHFKYFNSVSDGTNLADGWASYMLISQTPIELLKKGDEIMGRIMPASKPQTFKQRIKFAGKTRQGSYNLKGNVNAGSERFVFTSEILEGKWSLTASKKKGLVTLKKLK